MTETGKPLRNGGRTLTGVLSFPELPDDAAAAQAAGRVLHAEWALWGKEANVPGYHVLRCSNGSLRAADFHQVFGRYASGETGEADLPQYTVCWIPGEDGEPEYVGVGIRELADPDPSRAGGRVRASRGRDIEYIRLFCVPYLELAARQASYTELVRAVSRNQLPEGLTEPVELRLPEADPPQLTRPVRALAEAVATLLLTIRPVYIIGAQDVPAIDRLRFIDYVMSLLPYGARARLSASTWTSPTVTKLNFRLFFTDARRGAADGTCLTWGEPVRLDLEAADQPIRHYANWLDHGGRAALADLAEQDRPARFTPDDIRQLVADLPSERPVRDVLEELADGLRRADKLIVQRAVKRLQGHRRTSLPAPHSRPWFQQEIYRLGLFGAHEGLHPQTVRSVYRVLLDLSVELPFSYNGYCVITDCADGQLHPALWREVQSREFGSVVPWLLTMRTQPGLSDTMLWDYLREKGVLPADPVTEVHREAGLLRAGHRAAAYDSAVRYLRAAAPDPRAELRQLGFLTTTVALAFPGDEEAQRIRLEDTLRFVYHGPLAEEDARDAYGQPDLQPTPAFDAAVERLRRLPAAVKPPWYALPWLRALGTRRPAGSMNLLRLVGGLTAIVILVIAALLYVLLHTSS